MKTQTDTLLQRNRELINTISEERAVNANKQRIIVNLHSELFKWQAAFFIVLTISLGIISIILL
jgi:hypothetical protein